MQNKEELLRVVGCRPDFSREDLAFFAKLRKVQSVQPKEKARSFREFSSRILKVEYSSANGKCCIRGHADENQRDSDMPVFLRKRY